jgi:nicotinate-nucleotide adenylyltransferase
LRVGILGGAFNPPHIGHLICAQEALLQLGLDKLLFVPTGQPPHRALEDDPGPEVRLEMVEQAIAGDSRFAPSRIEIDREGPSYTADTLSALRAAEPDNELFLILGADQAASLPDWHEPERVLAQATIAVVERLGWNQNATAIKLARLRGTDAARYLDTPLIQVSSTVVRRRVGRGEPIRYLIPEGVASLIEERGLYSGGKEAGDAGAPSTRKAGATA